MLRAPTSDELGGPPRQPLEVSAAFAIGADAREGREIRP
jgi:hypothetical protein